MNGLVSCIFGGGSTYILRICILRECASSEMILGILSCHVGVALEPPSASFLKRGARAAAHCISRYLLLFIC